MGVGIRVQGAGSMMVAFAAHCCCHAQGGSVAAGLGLCAQFQWSK